MDSNSFVLKKKVKPRPVFLACGSTKWRCNRQTP